MPRYRVVLLVDGSRLPTIQKEAKAVFKGVVQVIHKVDLAKSRADRLTEIQQCIEGHATDVEELRDELQEWFDNLPEQFQSGGKGTELEDAIQALDEIKDSLEGVDFTLVSFPSMMG